MHTYELQFPGFDARSNLGEIRWELFLYPDVRQVQSTSREDTLLVVSRSEPNPRAWAKTLADAGLPVPRIHDASLDRSSSFPDDAAA
jgi:hypothetical protein